MAVMRKSLCVQNSEGAASTLAVARRFFNLALGVAVLCATAVPPKVYAQPGVSMGAPAGVNPPPGLYFSNNLDWGVGKDPYSGRAQSLAIETATFFWATGYDFLGASTAAFVSFVGVERGVSGKTYATDVVNPIISPISLSWNLGNGLFVSFREAINLPFESSMSAPGVIFEQIVGVTYFAKDWMISVNNMVGLTTASSEGFRVPNYYNVDLSVVRSFGQWRLGAVGYGGVQLDTTVLNAFAGKGRAVGVGGLVGYNFSNGVSLSVLATRQVLSEGATLYPKDDTRIWTKLSMPIWMPAPPAPK